MRNRFKSWALWLALAAMLVWIIKTVWGLDVGKQTDEFMNLLLPILVGFGIINNPTDADHL